MIELFTNEGVKIGEFHSLQEIKDKLDLLPDNLNIAPIKERRIQELNDVTDSYFYSCALKRGGYKNMGEINYDATVDNDPDAKFLQKLYDALWAKEAEIEEQIDKMSLEELLNLDIKKLTKTEYDKVLKELEASIESSTSNSDNEEGSNE